MHFNARHNITEYRRMHEQSIINRIGFIRVSLRMIREIQAGILKSTVRAAMRFPCWGPHSDGAHTLFITKQRAYLFIQINWLRGSHRPVYQLAELLYQNHVLPSEQHSSLSSVQKSRKKEKEVMLWLRPL